MFRKSEGTNPIDENVSELNTENNETNVKKQMKGKECSLNLRFILICILYALGLDIYFKSKHCLKIKIAWVLKIIAFFYLFYLIAIQTFQDFTWGAQNVKLNLSLFILHIIQALTWICILARKEKIPNILNDIFKLKQAAKTITTNLFESICVY